MEILKSSNLIYLGALATIIGLTVVSDNTLLQTGFLIAGVIITLIGLKK